jgi:hypothetical protein
MHKVSSKRKFCEKLEQTIVHHSCIEPKYSVRIYQSLQPIKLGRETNVIPIT